MSGTVLDLFAGIGGFSLALERHGFRTVAFSEIEPFCCRVLAHHWPGIPNLGDITQLTGQQVMDLVGPVSIVTGGFPCQDVSVAGKRAGLAGTRSGLFHHMTRIIREMRSATDGRYPAVFIGENVPGLLSADRGRDFARVLAGLAECGACHVAYRMLDAQFFGVPQRRRRVFIVACFTCRDSRTSRAGEILALTESVRRDSPAGRTAREDVACTLGGGTGDRGWCDDTDRMTFVPTWWDGGQIAQAIDAVVAKGQLMPERNRCPVVLSPGVRRLTPTECERLQSFPNGWTALPGITDAPRYRALGNAVCVNVVESIAARMAMDNSLASRSISC